MHRACKKGDGPLVGYIEFSEGITNPDKALVRDTSGASCSFVSASDVALEKKPLASTTFKVVECDLSKGFQLDFSSATSVSGKPLSVDPSGAKGRTGFLGAEVVSECRVWVPN